MPTLEHEIARHSATLELRRRRIQQQKQVLRAGAMELCKQPATLATAAAAGAVLERVLPDPRAEQRRSPAGTDGSSARSGVGRAARTLFFGLAPSLIRHLTSPL